MIKPVIYKTLRRMLPANVRRAILCVGFNVAREEFDRFAFLYGFAPNMQMGLSRLKDRGLAPMSVVDVGAFRGDWSRLARSLWPDAKLAMVEGNSQSSKNLVPIAAQLNAELYPELLGAADDVEVAFYAMEQGSSVFAERSSVPRTTEYHRSKKLDSVLATWDEIDLLKIDAQSSEIDILKGATRLLPNTKNVLLEISIIEINKGSPLLHDVIAYMKDRGFVACEILEIHRRPRDAALTQIDLLFVPEDSALVSDQWLF
jgi:FkbM family methyltransferase